MIDRRQVLLGSAGAAAALALRPMPLAATPSAMQGAIREIAGEQPLREGRVKLEVPPLVENGNAVPVTVTVDSPMTAADHVKAIHIINEKNPQPYVISASLGPRAGRAGFSTRIKLADSQKLVALAETSDGSFWSASADVVVTLAACIEERP